MVTVYLVRVTRSSIAKNELEECEGLLKKLTAGVTMGLRFASYHILKVLLRKVDRL